jgi:hypothetical protein
MPICTSTETRTVKPAETDISRERLSSRHVTAAIDMRARMGELLEPVISVRSVHML